MRGLGSAIAVGVVIATAGAAAEKPGAQFTQPLGLPLIETTVADVHRRLGPAPVSESGHYEETVCYVDQRTRTYVAFMAQGEGLSGSFTARRFGKRTPEGCSALPASALRQLRRGVGGLLLGMRRAEFAAAVGTTTLLPDGFLQAKFEWSESIDRAKHPLGVGDVLFTAIEVRGRFTGGRLVEFVIWKTAST